MSFADDLLQWYDGHRRALPWRGAGEAYRVWLSEIMLQQTQADTVKGYYARFLERFPDVFALAASDEAEVLKLWEGLGYYSRARNLRAAAQKVADELGGAFPRDAKGLKTLPGIGPYAANAIASIVYGEPVPALDGNQARVLSRVLGWDRPLKTPFDLAEPASELIDRKRPGDYNQALMDLGAMICTPRQPDCAVCPVVGHCRACAEGHPERYPVKRPAAQKKQQDWTILLVHVGEGVLVRRRPEGLLGGLYEFVAVEGHHEAGALAEWMTMKDFLNPAVADRLPDAKHVFTHRIWQMQGWRATCSGAPEGYIIADASALAALPFPSALNVYRRIAEQDLKG